MKSNVQYNGLKDYYKKDCKVNLKWVNIILISTIIILYIVNIKLKDNSLNTITDLKEINISKEIKQGNIVQENIEKESYDSVKVDLEFSNIYLDDNKKEFILKIFNGAIENYNKYGIVPSITIAQAILESGWGSSELAVNHNNIFGIKADSRWSGAIATISTSENYNDSTIANFRKYDSIDESLDDHGKFLSENPRYSEYGLFEKKNYKNQAQALEDAGYSTAKDKNGQLIYAEKLIGIIEKYNLMQYD